MCFIWDWTEANGEFASRLYTSALNGAFLLRSRSIFLLIIERTEHSWRSLLYRSPDPCVRSWYSNIRRDRFIGQCRRIYVLKVTVIPKSMLGTESNKRQLKSKKDPSKGGDSEIVNSKPVHFVKELTRSRPWWVFTYAPLMSREKAFHESSTVAELITSVCPAFFFDVCRLLLCGVLLPVPYTVTYFILSHWPE